MSGTEEIFTTSESEARLDLIRHLIENSELVPLVRGVSGIGKSLLASRLQARAPENWVVCHFDADSMLQPERLLAHIARCNGLPDAKEDNLRRLVERFETLRKRGRVPVLLVDDAQKLPPTSLITLLRLYERQVDGSPLVSLVLFADEQIDMLLSTPQLQVMSPQAIQVIDLPPLTREEADAFMLHLLELEGLDRGLVLDQARLTRLFRDTGGAPGPLASAILQAVGDAKDSPGSATVTRNISSPLLWGAVSLGVLLSLLLIFREPVRRFISPQPKPALIAGTQSGTDIENPPSDRVESEPEPERPAGESITAESQPEPSIPQASPAGDGETEAQAESSVEEQETKGVGEGPGAETAETDQVGSAETAPAATAEAQPPAPETAPAEVDVAPVLHEAQVVEVGPGSEKAQASAPRPAATPVAPESLLKSPAWLSEQASGGYTIQLMAGEQLESLADEAEAYGLQGEVFTVRTERQGRAWYPLLWGRFPDQRAAVEALKGLPAELRQAGAWIRSFASLQQ